MATGRSLARVIQRGAVTLVRKRFDVVAYDDHGRALVPDGVEGTIEAWPQPLSGDDLKRLPEGRRTKKTLKFYSLDEIFSADTSEVNMPDIIVVGDEEYEVQNGVDWVSDGAYWKAIAVRKDQ